MCVIAGARIRLRGLVVRVGREQLVAVVIVGDDVEPHPAILRGSARLFVPGLGLECHRECVLDVALSDRGRC